jgi:anti-sigma regulatory factor (Ser/Thr protein kinase)
MLLAEDLVTEDEAAPGEIAAFDFRLAARGPSGTDETSFFAQARGLIADGVKNGDITAEHAQDLAFLVERIEKESSQMETSGWEATELRKSLPSNNAAPREAREALSFVGADLPSEQLDTARLLASELVTNSLVHAHGPSTGDSSVGFFVSVERDVLRVEVSDHSPQAAIPKTPGAEGGFGLAFLEAMSTRWGSERTETGLNLTWFELDLVAPGASPS